MIGFLVCQKKLEALIMIYEAINFFQVSDLME